MFDSIGFAPNTRHLVSKCVSIATETQQVAAVKKLIKPAVIQIPNGEVHAAGNGSGITKP